MTTATLQNIKPVTPSDEMLAQHKSYWETDKGIKEDHIIGECLDNEIREVENEWSNERQFFEIDWGK